MLLLCIDLLAEALLNLNPFCLVWRTCLVMYFVQSQFIVVLGCLNSRSPAWWSKDITSLDDTQTYSLTTAHGFKQIILDPTRILPRSSSCIDLVFTNQPNFVIDCGTHPSFHPNCYHQITFCKLNLKVEYPPTYDPVVCNFKISNNGAIKKAIELVN